MRIRRSPPDKLKKDEGLATSHLAVGRIHFTLPRPVYAANSDLREIVEGASPRWNGLGRELFTLAEEDSPDGVLVIYGSRTWVEMPINSARTIIHWDIDTPDIWMAHELGHALGLGDHVWPGIDTRHYINPVIDRGDDPNRYHGVMSYVADASEWFGTEDRLMVATHFPVPGLLRQGYLPGLSRDQA